MFEAINIIHTIKNRLKEEDHVFHFVQRGQHSDDAFRELVRCISSYFYQEHYFIESEDIEFFDGYKGVMVRIRPKNPEDGEVTYL